MKLLITYPAKALNKAYLKQSLKREQIDLFKKTLARLFEQIKVDESEEHLKNTISEFLKNTWYKDTNEINTYGRTDLAIYQGSTAASPVSVLIEVKKPGNKSEMISEDRPNAKALHELFHYYMKERYLENNTDIKHLIVCNIHEWYIFDASDIEAFFIRNQSLVKSYKSWSKGTLPGLSTDWLYTQIIKPEIDQDENALPCAYFNLKEFHRTIRSKASTEDTKLLSLYKILSPAHLLKQSFANDSNTLNKEFYTELLHIIGLEEVKEKGKKLIQRKPEGNRNPGSLLENAYDFLKARNRLSYLSNPQQYGINSEDQYFGITLELCITWLNRVLFLKLLEGQLIAYQKGDRSYAFLNIDRVKDYDELNELFFDVLAVKVPDRSADVQSKFGKIPYLNSSLFEESDLERSMMKINELKSSRELPLPGQTVLKSSTGKRRTGNENTISYLFDFLDAYDFGAEGSADIQEQNKTIINASVLGLIFEKINGYKEGSFFTPGFITMYICKETIRRAVVKKFNEAYEWSSESITDLYNEIYRHKVPLQEANSLVNSLRICDPAVGSGHFLVSALNELIAVKSELMILASEDGKCLHCDITIENDELIVTVDDHIFEYNCKDTESQKIQETLFHEKETIIENCLFGVDINAKSVAICRLRLWIEMLKNSYYRRDSKELETLPNIDINIKCGNSLISRFSLVENADMKAASKSKMKELTEKYRKLVVKYKKSPEDKIQVRHDIEIAKNEMENFGLPNDKDFLAFNDGQEQLSVQSLFGFNKKEQEIRKKLQVKVGGLEKRIIEKKVIYRNAFEWRFEFPEVLDDDGEFVGFDAIIGNPPYGNLVSKDYQKFFAENYQHQDYQKDLYLLFMERYEQLLSKQSIIGIIIPNTWLQSLTFIKIRQYMTNHYQWSNLLQLPDNVFDAVVDTLVLVFENNMTSETPHKVPVYVRKNGNIELSQNIDWADIPKNGDPINIVANTQSRIVYAKILSSSVMLSTICEVFNGVKPFEKAKGTPPQTAQVLKEKPYVCVGPRPDESWSPLLRGSLIRRYEIVWNNDYWIKYGPWLAAPRDASIFEAPEKIMVRQTGDSIIATLVVSGFVARNNLHILLPQDKKYDLYFILGLLNSKLTGFAYSMMNPEKGEALAEVKKNHVEQLPVPAATEDQQASII